METRQGRGQNPRPKPSATLSRTVPPLTSGSATRATVCMAASAGSPTSRNRAPALVRVRPEAERTNRVDFRAVSSRATRRLTVAVSTPST